MKDNPMNIQVTDLDDQNTIISSDHFEIIVKLKDLDQIDPSALRFMKQSIIGSYGILLAPSNKCSKYKQWLTDLHVRISNDLSMSTKKNNGGYDFGDSRFSLN